MDNLNVREVYNSLQDFLGGRTSEYIYKLLCWGSAKKEGLDIEDYVKKGVYLFDDVSTMVPDCYRVNVYDKDHHDKYTSYIILTACREVSELYEYEKGSSGTVRIVTVGYSACIRSIDDLRNLEMLFS